MRTPVRDGCHRCNEPAVITLVHVNGSTQVGAPPRPEAGTVRAIFHDRWSVFMLLFGYVLPVIVGILVRSHLQAIGKPVVEWSWFFYPVRVVQMLILLAYWDIPFFLVAWLHQSHRLPKRGNPIIIFCGFLGTSAASAVLFADLWRNIEAVLLGAVIVPFFILPGTLLGLAIGWFVVRLRKF